MNTISRLSTVVTVDSVRKARIVWFSWKRAKMSPRLALGEEGIRQRHRVLEELRHHREVHVAHHEVRQVGADRRHDLGEHVGDDQADDQQVQQAHVLVHDHAVEDVLDDHRRHDAQHLDHEGRQEQMQQDLLVRLQVADEAYPWRARRRQLRHVLAGREHQAGAAPAALEFLHAHLLEADRRVGHPDLARSTRHTPRRSGNPPSAR